MQHANVFKVLLGLLMGLSSVKVGFAQDREDAGHPYDRRAVEDVVAGNVRSGLYRRSNNEGVIGVPVLYRRDGHSIAAGTLYERGDAADDGLMASLFDRRGGFVGDVIYERAPHVDVEERAAEFDDALAARTDASMDIEARRRHHQNHPKHHTHSQNQHKPHAHKPHAHKPHAHKPHAHKPHAHKPHKLHAHKLHAHKLHAHKLHTNKHHRRDPRAEAQSDAQ